MEAKGKGKGKPKTKAKGRGKDGKGGGRAPAVSRVEFPDRLCPDRRKGQECKYGKDCRFSHEKKKFGPDGKLKGKGAAAVGSAAGDQNKAGAGPEGLDWEPPGGLGRAGCVSRPAGGAPSPFGCAVRLGKVGAAEPGG